MKTLVKLALVVALMSTSAMARWYEGTINEVWQLDDGSIKVTATINNAKLSRYLVPYSQQQKEFLTIALTAVSTGSPVMLDYVDSKWQGIAILSR